MLDAMEEQPTISGNLLVAPHQLCRASREDGQPCRAPAVRSTELCPMHDPVRLARRRPSGAASVVPINLDSLCQLDLGIPENLKSFRSGMLTAMVRGELDSTRAARACEIAASIHLAGRDADASSTLASLAGVLDRAMARPLDVSRETSDHAPGEGGQISQGQMK